MNPITKCLIIIALITRISADETFTKESFQKLETALPEKFHDFVSDVINNQCPSFPSKQRVEGMEAQLADLSYAIWKKASSERVDWSAADLSIPNQEITDMIKLRNWVASQKGYGNIIVASSCEEMVSMAVIEGLARSALTVEKAASHLAALKTTVVSFRDVLQVIAKEDPSSRKVRRLLDLLQKGDMPSMTGSARDLAEEQPELDQWSGRENLFKQTNGPSLLRFAATSALCPPCASAFVLYVQRGGSLTADLDIIKADLPKRIPEVFEEKSPITGDNLYPLSFIMILKDLVKK